MTTSAPPAVRERAVVIPLCADGDVVAIARERIADAGHVTHVTFVVERMTDLHRLEQSGRRLALAFEGDGPALRLVVARGDAQALARNLAAKENAELLD